MAKNQFKETTVFEKLYGKPKKYQYYPVKFRIYPSNNVANGIPMGLQPLRATSIGCPFTLY